MISIVDDDEFVRESTKALVRSLGYSARTFSSAEEFLESNPNETSCLILDVQMKGLKRRRAAGASDCGRPADTGNLCHGLPRRAGSRPRA